MLLDSFLQRSAERHPEKTALICGERRANYAEVNGGANALGHALQDLGLAKQDRVCMFYDNSVEVLQGVFGTLKASGIFLIVNPGVKGDKLAFILNDCSARFLVTGRRNLKGIEAEVAACPDLRGFILVDGVARAGDYPLLEAAGKPVHALSELLAKHPHTLPKNPSINIDLAALVYTSGSTGNPKGVMLTHHNMVTASTSITTYLRNEPDDIILSCLPLAFDYGLYQAIMTFHVGATLVLERQFIYPGRYLELVEKEGCTGLPIVPTILGILLSLKDLEQHDFSKVRYFSNTAQALPMHYIKKVRQLVPHARFYSMYGLTECKRVSYLPPEFIDQKPNSVGIAIPGTEVWIEDDQGQRISEAWRPGELMVRGAHVMPGYWNRPEENARYLKPGRYPYERTLCTGDLFKMDEEGHLYFISRKDDLIKTAGERVGPREVENAIYEIPGVKECGVIGVPDDLLGHAIKAFIALEQGAQVSVEDVIKHCQIRLERFMVPKHVAFIAELPKTNTGKISKKGLS